MAATKKDAPSYSVASTKLRSPTPVTVSTQASLSETTHGSERMKSR